MKLQLIHFRHTDTCRFTRREYLYFSSDMPGGYGGKDIWRISLTDKGGSLENMGVQINTPGNEMFPYVRSDGDLYFSSDGHPGWGDWIFLKPG